MKIGVDCRMYSSNFTGVGRCTYEVVKSYIEENKKQGYPHELVLFFNEPEYSSFEESKNVKKILVNAKHYSLAEQIGFAKKLYKEKLDLVHFPHFNHPILYRKPFIVTIHDLTLSLYPGKKMTKWYHRLAYHIVIRNAVKKAKKIIAVSRNTKNDIIRFLRVDPKKITVIHNGLTKEFTFIHDVTKFDKTLKKYKIKKPFLLYTGNWRDHKNLVRLVKAFKILKEKYYFDFNLVLTGKENSFYPEVKQTIKDLELENEIILPGLVSEEELVYLYNAAFIYVFPSLYEGFGLPPLEAMACGTPVVASFSSSMPEILKDNVVYFDPYDEKDLAEKIQKLHTDVKLQTELIGKGMDLVKEYNIDDMTKKTYKLLTEINV